MSLPKDGTEGDILEPDVRGTAGSARSVWTEDLHSQRHIPPEVSPAANPEVHAMLANVFFFEGGGTARRSGGENSEDDKKTAKGKDGGKDKSDSKPVPTEKQPAVPNENQFFSGQLSDADRKRLESEEVKPELIEAISKKLNAVGKDPQTAILDAVKSNRVVALGETHVSPNGLQEDGIALIPKMKEAGLTHLAVEIRKSQQGMLDEFLQGKISSDEFKTRFFETHDHKGHGDDWLKLMKTAHNAGIKVVAVDDYKNLDKIEYLGISKETATQRDKSMSGMIGDILDKDPKAKVLFWVGADHLEKGVGKYQCDTAGELLRQKGKKDGFGIAVFGAQLEDSASGNRTEATLAGMARRPVAFQTDQVPDYSKLPTDRGKKFESVILYPKDHSLKLLEQKYGKEDPRIIPKMDQTALSYAHDGKVDKALAMQERSKELVEKKFGKDSPEYVQRLTQTGLVFDAVRDRTKAQQQFKLAYEAAEKLPAEKRFAILEPAARLESENLNRLKLRDDAGTHIHKALAVLKDEPELYKELRKEANRGRNQGNTLVVAERLLELLDNKPEKARELAQALLSIEEKNEKEPGHFRITGRHLTLGDVNEKLGKTAEAEKHYTAALANAEKATADYTFRRTLGEVAAFNIRHKNFDKAEEQLSRRLELVGQAKYKMSSELIGTTTQLGTVFAGQGKNDKAEKYFKDAIQLGEKEKEVSGSTVSAYADFLKKTGRVTEADALKKKYQDPERGR